MGVNQQKMIKIANYMIGNLASSDVSGQRAILREAMVAFYKYSIFSELENCLLVFTEWLNGIELKYQLAFDEDKDLYDWIDPDFDSDYNQNFALEERQRWYLHIFTTIGGIRGMIMSVVNE